MNDSFDKHGANRQVAIWLLAICSLVFLMVVLGGFTRLTGSGLSMVDWRPVTGWLPPLSDTEWRSVFELYQASPEFQKVNSHMDVDDFKGIFWLEYIHRLIGRSLAPVFAIPFVVFLVRRSIPLRQAPKYLAIFVLGGLQGLLGWYMVASGLIDNPHVSQYRLVAHLSGAFLIYAVAMWLALSLLYPDKRPQRHPWFRRMVGLTGLVSLTVVSGGFVAGLKAGLIYNTFPKMGDYWIPPGLTALEPVWRNLTENLATAQFDHRLLAIVTLALILLAWWKLPKADLPPATRRAASALLHTGVLQVALGITTLLLAVPVVLGAAHQAVAMLLFTVSLYLTHRLR